jgi:hypothetical protein
MLLIRINQGEIVMSTYLLLPITRNEKFEEWKRLTELRMIAPSADTICPRCNHPVPICYCPELLAQEILEEAEWGRWKRK